MSCLNLLDQQVCQAVLLPLAVPLPSVGPYFCTLTAPRFIFIYTTLQILFYYYYFLLCFNWYLFFPTHLCSLCYTSCFLHIYPVYYSYLLALPFPIVSLTTTSPFLHFLYTNHLYPCSFYAVTLKTDISTYLPNYIDNHNPEDTNFHGSFYKNI